MGYGARFGALRRKCISYPAAAFADRECGVADDGCGNMLPLGPPCPHPGQWCMDYKSAVRALALTVE